MSTNASGWFEQIFAKLKATRYSFSLWFLFTVLIGVISYHFYPDYHFWADGGWQGWRLVCAIDFVMGPVLFFIVFWPGKPKSWLLLDIVILFSVQLSAMGWGLYSVLKQRPVADSYTMNGFQSLSQAPYQRSGLDIHRLHRLSPASVPKIYVRAPHRSEIADLVSKASNGIPAAAQWKYLEPITAADSILNNAHYQKNFQDWLKTDMGKSIWIQWQTVHPAELPTSLRYALFIGRYRNAVLFFDNVDNYRGYVLFADGASVPII